MAPDKNPTVLGQLHKQVKDLASIAPLLAAIVAPLSVLFDIPALGEKWYLKDGIEQPDPRASLILSSISLGSNVVANILLIVRFSTSNEWWRVATRVSILWWIIKVVVALVNLIIFGILTRNAPDFSYTEGFWCAVVSLLLSSLVLGLLLLHFFIEFLQGRKSPTNNRVAKEINRAVRVAGRHFMLQTTSFTGLIALTALIFSKIEGWSYLQGMYFANVTFLTVGFGDFYPTKTATQIVLFPLALLGIATLGTLVQMIVSWFQERMEARRKRRREEDEQRWRELIEGIVDWDREWQSQYDHEHSRPQKIVNRMKSVAQLGVGRKVSKVEPEKMGSSSMLPPTAYMGIERAASDLVQEHYRNHHQGRGESDEARRERHERERDESSTEHLQREIAHLEAMHAMYDTTDHLQSLFLSLGGFAAFWLVGAALFASLEGWHYGRGLYFCYIFFLSIGYGDFAPISPAGRVVFIIYSIVAVPIMASFALSTVTSIFTKISTWELNRRRAASGLLITASALATDSGYAKVKAEMAHPNENDPSKGAREGRGKAGDFERSKRGWMIRSLWRCGGEREGKSRGRDEKEMEEGGVEEGVEDGDVEAGNGEGRGDLDEVKEQGENAVKREIWEREKVLSHSAFVLHHHSRLDEQDRQRSQSQPQLPMQSQLPERSARAESSAAVSPTSVSVKKSIKSSSSSTTSSSESSSSESPALEQAQAETAALTSLLLQHACELELHARRLLIHYLPDGSKAEVVLKADRNVQVRDVKAVREARRRAREEAGLRLRDSDGDGEDGEAEEELENEEERHEDDQIGILAGMKGPEVKVGRGNVNSNNASGRRRSARGSSSERVRRDEDTVQGVDEDEEAFERVWDELTKPMSDEQTMEEVRKYRESFAAVLAVGSRLRKVEGLERLLIERRR